MPCINDPGDALVKVTATCICGSDLHMYNGYFPGMQKGGRMRQSGEYLELWHHVYAVCH